MHLSTNHSVGILTPGSSNFPNVPRQNTESRSLGAYNAAACQQEFQQGDEYNMTYYYYYYRKLILILKKFFTKRLTESTF